MFLIHGATKSVMISDIHVGNFTRSSTQSDISIICIITGNIISDIPYLDPSYRALISDSHVCKRT